MYVKEQHKTNLGISSTRLEASTCLDFHKGQRYRIQYLKIVDCLITQSTNN